ncbi:hypothetical protein L2E82_21853 [Cichorium intybus]|uniref:Uncharacterized protein n=1 Tax=Cichorium intybus TaxID=13427 RepID=A0ACB9DWL8_CICIN|nr:hypothetical protein L2E82_21853 [Cichorium intybus]
MSLINHTANRHPRCDPAQAREEIFVFLPIFRFYDQGRLSNKRSPFQESLSSFEFLKRRKSKGKGDSFATWVPPSSSSCGGGCCINIPIGQLGMAELPEV